MLEGNEMGQSINKIQHDDSHDHDNLSRCVEHSMTRKNPTRFQLPLCRLKQALCCISTAEWWVRMQHPDDMNCGFQAARHTLRAASRQSTSVVPHLLSVVQRPALDLEVCSLKL